jgi:hypothetical protein
MTASDKPSLWRRLGVKVTKACPNSESDATEKVEEEEDESNGCRQGEGEEVEEGIPFASVSTIEGRPEEGPK